MSVIVSLTVSEGNGKTEEFDFDSSSRCLVGRSADCRIQLPTDSAHADVSRRHCLFEVDPPRIRVRDLGSLNGTFVNEEIIGRRRPDQTPEETVAETYAGRELKEGDVVRVGNTRMRVGVLAAEWLPEPVVAFR